MTQVKEFQEAFEQLVKQGQGNKLVREFIDLIRPDHGQQIDMKVRRVLDCLKENQEIQARLHDKVRDVFKDTRLVHTLAEQGILSDKGFWANLRARIAEKVLPLPPRQGGLSALIRDSFTARDHVWITKVEPRLWQSLFEVLFRPEDLVGIPHPDLAAAAMGLAQRIGALGIDEELNARLHEVEDYDSPFLCLTGRVSSFLATLSGREYAAVLQNLQDCKSLVESLRDQKKKIGTSLRLTATTRRLLQQLGRLELLLHTIHPEDLQDFCSNLVPLFTELIEAECTAHNLRRLIHEHVDLLAFQITELSAKKGAKYIVDSAKGYWAFLRAAMAGGAIVAVFAIVKILLSGLQLSLAMQAMLYSLNYATCFVLIYITGSILATKQPAVTASAIVKCMDDRCSAEDQLEQVADTFVLIWRSQFISFVGNLICAFPVAIFLVWLLQLTGVELVSQGKAHKLLNEVHPLHSGALIFAAIAGVFLFTAGILSAWIDNHVLYDHFDDRLRYRLGNRSKVASFVSDNMGMILGNVILGFLLGSAGTLGLIFGLPFDIRHIALLFCKFGHKPFYFRFRSAAEPDFVEYCWGGRYWFCQFFS